MVDARTADALVLVPGIMGSELRDAHNRVVWGMKPGVLFRQLASRDVLKRLQLKPGAPDDGIRPSGLIAFPSYLPILDGIEPYTEMTEALRSTTLHPDAVLEFPYDWRRSVASNATLLEAAAIAHLEGWKRRVRDLPDYDPRGDEPKLTLVCHSMGGLLARYFNEVLGHRDITRRVISLGTPYAGSMKAVRILARGDILPLGLLAASVRDAARTFPGVYDLLPRYPCVQGQALAPLTAQVAAEVGADPVLFESAAADHRTVIDAARSAGAGACPIRAVVGVTQPTLVSMRVAGGEATFDERLDSDVRRGGDGTVGRDHAFPSASTPSYLPQKHGKLAATPESVTFVQSVLTEIVPGAFQGDGIGLRLPDAASAQTTFEVEIEVDKGPAMAMCRLVDAGTGHQVDQQATARRDGRWKASLSAPHPGLYRVSAAGGGFSPVEDILLVQ